jgi:hypothetical protein
MRRRSKWLRALLAIGGVIALTGAEGLDPGEIHCEEAVKHLSDCCHQSFPAYDCTAERGCGNRHPDLDDPQASQVRDTSCEDLIAQGACASPPMTPQPVPPPQQCSYFCVDLAGVDLRSPPDLARPHDLSWPQDLAAPEDLSLPDGGGDL